MKLGKSYRATRFGNTLLASAVVGSGGAAGETEARVRLLVDTGASYTMLKVETLVRLGYDLSQPFGHVRLVSANGIIVAPLVKLSWFNCMGQLLRDFTVAAHTIRGGGFAGVLGMDFLTRCRAIIAVAEGELSFRRAKADRK